MKRWTVESLPWDQFDNSKVNPALLAYAKAASLVEANAEYYVRYLHNIFPGDIEFQKVITQWGEEEKQHGRALRAWAEKADPSFDYDDAMARFRRAFQFPWESLTTSLRGSQALELVSRCVIETGTSSFYTAMRDATSEPVFKEICRRIAGDEIRHYNLFYKHLEDAYSDKVSRLARTRTVLQRSFEVTDEELCFAYAAANTTGEINPSELPVYAKHYFRFMANIFEPKHLHNAITMVSRAAGVPLKGWMSRGIGHLVHRGVQTKLWFLEA